MPTVRVKPQHAVAFLGPEPDLSGRPCPTACVAEPLRFRQITLAPPQGIFGPMAFLNVDSGSIPTNDVSQLVAQGHVADQQPAIIPVHAPQPCFTLHWVPSCDGGLPLADNPGEVIGMNQGTPTPTESVRHRSPQKLQQTLIDEINGAVRPSAPDISRNSVDDEPEAIFALL